MLTLTDNANAVVTTIVTGQENGDDAGLRIESAPAPGPNGEARFAVHVVPSPEPADQIIEAAGTRVYLETAAAEALADKVLDAGVDGEGTVNFTILPQPA
ncbi:iron-sulfur cluster assembly protein [Microbacterium sp. ZKA21]|uniref:Fe-S cluster assembly protein HesB n=1 Tax=Microbacterium sp. ZKA21 TaxID=3381694 RepID=UPI003D1D8799